MNGRPTRAEQQQSAETEWIFPPALHYRGRYIASDAVIAPPIVQMIAKMRSASSRAATAALAPEIASPDPTPDHECDPRSSAA